MDDIYLMTVFVAVGEELSLAGAGRRLDMSSASVTRAVNYLERKRGVEFLQRNTRGISLTGPGEKYLDDARAILQLVADAEATAVGANTAPNGLLRVTAPVLFGKSFIVPGIADYLSQYPEMEISAMFVDRNVNLIDEGFDVAIRIGQLPDSGMKAIKVGQVSKRAYASPGYLEKNGIPGHPSDLQKHQIISTDVSAQHVTWKFGLKKNAMSVKLTPVLGLSSNDAAINAARLGIGIIQVPSYQVVEQVKNGELQAVLNDFPSESLPINLLHRESKFSSSKVRIFIDLLSQRLRSELLSQ